MLFSEKFMYAWKKKEQEEDEEEEEGEIVPR